MDYKDKLSKLSLAMGESFDLPIKSKKEREGKRVMIKVFVTKNRKFRAQIIEGLDKPYEVTVGGKSWNNGVAKKHHVYIKHSIRRILEQLADNYYKILEDDN